MFNNFEDMQKLSKDAAEATMQSLSAASQGAQTIAIEAAEFARKALDQGASAMDKLLNARSLDGAVEVQTRYAQAAFEGAMTQASKLGEIYLDLGKQVYRPLETYFAKARSAA